MLLLVGAFCALSLLPGSGLAAEQVLRLVSPGEAESFDPAHRHFAADRVLGTILLEGLTREDGNGEPVPGAAESWEVSGDGLRYVFHLRPNARFSDGQPVTAENFVYAARRWVDPKTASEATNAIEPVLHARECIGGRLPPEALGIEAIDPLTLAVTLERPNPYFPALAGQLVPMEQAVVERWGNAWTEPEHMVSNGPFALAEFVLHGTVAFVRNPRYWNAANIKLDRVTFASVENSRTAQRMFQAGEVDAVSLSSEDFKNGGPLPGAQLRLQPIYRVAYLFFNMRNGPLAESRGLRRALALALDQDTLTTKILKSISQPAFAMVPAIYANYPHPRETFADRPMAERIAEARKLYADAGFGPGRPLSVKAVLGDKKSCAAIQEMWRVALGFVAECDIEDDHGAEEAYKTGQFDVGDNGDGGPVPDPYKIISDFRGQPVGAENTGRYDSPAYDATLAEAEETSDLTARAKKLAEAERVLLDDQAVIPLSFSSGAYAVAPRVHGYRMLASRALFLDDTTVDP
ncbi:ABC transporter substrate-binding protein [Aliidongia dinghuensis]|uniref:ABC transporter substrate-binding protein n=1 Tax=Aliidongia dinghuensis TaxID=1867774 RepID=A0A8J2YPP1_9PROT|nr:ABC transporter substrate-binding protein [Aliidongia dinghuensis]